MPIGQYPHKKKSVEERFLAKIEKLESGCWQWLGGKYSNGYGAFYMLHPDGTGKNALAHRAAYQLFRGEIPPGLVIDHLCKLRSCVNPDHLEAVTPRENLLRGDSVSALNSRATHCLRGHPLSGVNLIITSQGFRNCLECERVRTRERVRKYRERKASGQPAPQRQGRSEKKGQPIRPLKERFEEKYVKQDDGCWRWTGAISSPTGYGAFYVGNWKSKAAHRVSYELYVGPIPEGLVINHICKFHYCVNPNHLEAVSQQENLSKGDGWAGVNSRATHCVNGHPLSGENSHIRPQGWRGCRACGRDRARKYRRNKPPVKKTLKTHCPQGHPYDRANTYHSPNGDRKCRACHRAESTRRYHRLKEKQQA